MMRSVPSAPPAPNRPRGWIAALPFLLVTVCLGGVYAVVAHRLPERLATHFGGDGRPDGYASAQGLLWGCLGILLVLGVGIGVLVRLGMPARSGRTLIATGYFTAVVLGYPAAVVLFGNAAATDAAAVRMPLSQLAAALGAGALAAGLGWLLAGPDPEERRPEPGRVRRLDLPAGVRAGWTRTVSSPPMAALAALMACGGIVMGAFAGWVGGGALLLGALTVAVHCSVRVTVDQRGLTLTPALFPFPLHRVPLDKVAEATSRRISTLAEYGGWGYRIRPGGSGLLLRSGDGLVLRRTNGREFVVTVDDAATAAALLTTCLDRKRSTQGD
ncbi:DUF1648 domain-containing protein [Streptomyces lunalinharesii]|uniref:DUF1648 domain-containing protein n=1 Tax=Streptomyces lunalinharesii TaxID=333384 RepID=A0ABN3SPF6_9ACTN